MKTLKVVTLSVGSFLVGFILLDFPKMGELLTAIRLFLLFAVIGILWSVGIIFEHLFNRREE